MTTEQRRALVGTIPTTEVIRDAVTFPRDRLGEPLDISPERFEAWLARVKRDAARDALKQFRKTELAIIPPDADEDDSIRVRQQALAWRIEVHLLANYPEQEEPSDPNDIEIDWSTNYVLSMTPNPETED